MWAGAVLWAYAAWLQGRHQALIVLLAVATVVLRSELVLLAAPLLLLEWLRGRVSLVTGIRTGVLAGAAALGATLGPQPLSVCLEAM
jgi:hypothetical protein